MINNSLVMRIKFVFLVILALAAFENVSFAAVINHNISASSLTISGSSTDDYVVTGSTNYNHIHVGFGYKGTITLKDCSFRFTDSGTISPIRIEGQDNLSNTSPSRTNVNLILDGKNTIYNDGGGRAGIQVDQGAQINISAIDPCDNNSGILEVTQVSEDGGAGIGSLNHYMNSNETTSFAQLSNGSSGMTAGGNIIISSGTITTKGGHGAGLGGGYESYYDGMIVVYGGIVHASTIRHAAGIGSGCPTGDGVVQEYAPNSAVVVLPPSEITAIGAGGSAGATAPNPELALAGTKVRVYIGDPNKPTIKVRTVDYLPNANVYFDLSQDPDINSVVTTTINPEVLNINNVLLGKTNSSGVFTTTGSLTNPTTFYTDASSTSASTAGSPYKPVTKTMPNGGEVEFPLLPTKINIKLSASTILETNYSNSDAQKAAAVVKIIYDDPQPLLNVTFDLASGASSAFSDLIFYASDDSVDPVPVPTRMQQGDVIYVRVPIKTGQAPKVYTDVLRMSGMWNGESTGYIRQVVSQIVADIQTVHICAGGSYYFNGKYLTEEGIYAEISTESTSCGTESSVSNAIRLIIDPVKHTRITESICDGDYYEFHGKKLTQIGVYQETVKTAYGCDSIIELTLYVNPTYQIPISAEICQGKSYSFGGKELTTSGTYYENLKTIKGCDSIYVLQLKVNPTYYFPETASICDYETYTYRGNEYKTTGTYPEKLSTSCNCDSIYELSLTVTPTKRDTTTATICATEYYTFAGEQFNKSGFYSDTTYQPTYGRCEIQSLDLTVSEPTVITSASVGEVCANDSVYKIDYKIEGPKPLYYSLIYDAKAREMGFTDVINAPFTASVAGEIPQLPETAYLRPDTYHVRLEFDNGSPVCNSAEFAQDIAFLVKYPSWITEQNWNDVVALLNQDYNGGYRFSQVDWFINNYEVEHDAKTYLYAPNSLKVGSVVHAQLIREGEDYSVCTCPIVIEDRGKENSKEPVLVKVLSMQKQIIVSSQEDLQCHIFDIYGNNVYQSVIPSREEVTISLLSLPPGMYVILLEGQHYQQSYKIFF